MIIGITGHARNGKDSIADILVSDFNFEHLSFAWPIKEACKAIFGWTNEHVNGSLKDVEDKEWGITPRLALQLLGTDFGQFTLCEKSISFASTTGRSLWVKRALDGIDNKNVVISDVRFLHEAESIKKAGGYIFRVIRPGYESLSTHASETEMVEIKEDFCIMNDRSLNDLQHAVYSAMVKLGLAKMGISK
jgi:hypothetical protein